MRAEDAEFFRRNPFANEMWQELRSLPPWKQAAFAAYCSERLAPRFQAYASRHLPGEQHALDEVIEQVWAQITGGGEKAARLAELGERVQRIDLGEDPGAKAEAAISALGAVDLTLDTLRAADGTQAARAAATVLDQLDYELMNGAVGRNYSLTADETMAVSDEIDRSPETERMREDLRQALREVEGRSVLRPEDVARLRSRARSDW